MSKKMNVIDAEVEIMDAYLSVGNQISRAEGALMAVSNVLISARRADAEMTENDRKDLEFAEEKLDHILMGLLRIRFSLDTALGHLSEGEG